MVTALLLLTTYSLSAQQAEKKASREMSLLEHLEGRLAFHIGFEGRVCLVSFSCEGIVMNKQPVVMNIPYPLLEEEVG
jgi:hypothetical protein